MTPEIRKLLKEARTIIRAHARWSAKDWDERATKVLATPPQRTWVDLTEKKIKDIWLNGKDHGDDWLDILALARSFEAELKELNK